jgi:hypothetical protein
MISEQIRLYPLATTRAEEPYDPTFLYVFAGCILLAVVTVVFYQIRKCRSLNQGLKSLLTDYDFKIDPSPVPQAMIDCARLYLRSIRYDPREAPNLAFGTRLIRRSDGYVIHISNVAGGSAWSRNFAGHNFTLMSVVQFEEGIQLPRFIMRPNDIATSLAASDKNALGSMHPLAKLCFVRTHDTEPTRKFLSQVEIVECLRQLRHLHIDSIGNAFAIFQDSTYASKSSAFELMEDCKLFADTILKS